MNDNFIQNNGFFAWFTGVIEDIHDPEERGRYRVRCYGYHTEDKGAIPIGDLPWAHVMMPVTSASVSGIGESATGLVKGSWVVGFFRDGSNCQDPVIMGSIPSQSSQPDFSKGFSDPTRRYPEEEFYDKSDTPIEARKEYKESFSYTQKKDFRNDIKKTKSSSKATVKTVGGQWKLSKVEDTIGPEYPQNHVKQYEKKANFDNGTNSSKPVITKDADGNTKLEYPQFVNNDDSDKFENRAHTVEFDTTPGKERISTMHRSGTYEEIIADGTRESVIVGNDYKIVAKDNNVYVQGSCNLTVDGNCNTLIEGDWNIAVKGNKNESIDGTLNQTVGGNVSETYKSNHNCTVSGDQTYDQAPGGDNAVSQTAIGGIYKIKANRIDLN